MLLTLLEFMWWLQPAAAGGGGAGDGGGGGGGAAADGGMGCAMQAGLFGVMMVVFYFFLLRPEQKRRREHEELMKSLRKGTKVRTTGGLLGEVVTVSDDEVVLQIADRVRVNVLRSAVTTIESARKAAGDDATTKKASEKDEPEKDKDKDKKESSRASRGKDDSAEARDEV